MTSGLGATGWTGLVCLAASFFRLTRLFSNISWTELCFWNTLSIRSWWRMEDTCSCTRVPKADLIKSGESLASDPELRIEHCLVLTADGAVVRKGVETCRVQVSLQLLQGCFGSILRLTTVYWLVRQQEDTVLAPLGHLQRKHFSVLEALKGTSFLEGTPTFSKVWWSSSALSRRLFLLLRVELICSHTPLSSLHFGLMESSA